jgi:hypothetical protein
VQQLATNTFLTGGRRINYRRGGGPRWQGANQLVHYFGPVWVMHLRNGERIFCLQQFDPRRFVVHKHWPATEHLEYTFALDAAEVRYGKLAGYIT